jgi:hypothetical protein
MPGCVVVVPVDSGMLDYCHRPVAGIDAADSTHTMSCSAVFLYFADAFAYGQNN